ncbi:hypothetical protein SDC9_90380 [bioreactor metagenome]|uniref:Uncharacterized protein n=1 Tax=bioreactor metagenome TaxID=1076179 RepID=A0A644ZYK5_9ZZZZ
MLGALPRLRRWRELGAAVTHARRGGLQPAQHRRHGRWGHGQVPHRSAAADLAAERHDPVVGELGRGLTAEQVPTGQGDRPVPWEPQPRGEGQPEVRVPPQLLAPETTDSGHPEGARSRGFQDHAAVEGPGCPYEPDPPCDDDEDRDGQYDKSHDADLEDGQIHAHSLLTPAPIKNSRTGQQHSGQSSCQTHGGAGHPVVSRPSEAV